MGDADESLDELLKQRRALMERSDDLGALVATGDITPAQLKRANKVLASQLADLDVKITKHQDTGGPVAVLLGADDLRTRWSRFSPDEKAQTIDDLMEVTINRASHKGREFDYSRVNINWKA